MRKLRLGEVLVLTPGHPPVRGEAGIGAGEVRLQKHILRFDPHRGVATGNGKRRQDAQSEEGTVTPVYSRELLVLRTLSPHPEDLFPENTGHWFSRFWTLGSEVGPLLGGGHPEPSHGGHLSHCEQRQCTSNEIVQRQKEGLSNKLSSRRNTKQRSFEMSSSGNSLREGLISSGGRGLEEMPSQPFPRGQRTESPTAERL